jgi:hypothetical protein
VRMRVRLLADAGEEEAAPKFKVRVMWGAPLGPEVKHAKCYSSEPQCVQGGQHMALLAVQHIDNIFAEPS